MFTAVLFFENRRSRDIELFLVVAQIRKRGAGPRSQNIYPSLMLPQDFVLRALFCS